MNRSTGKSPFELVYGTQPNLVKTLTGPKLVEPIQVPSRNEPEVVRAFQDQQLKETQRVEKSHVHLHHRHEIGDEVWVMNPDHSKLQPEKVGPAIILKVNPNNTYLVQGLGKRKRDKVIHHNRLRPCTSRKRQREAALQATDHQLVQYGARVPDELPADIPSTDEPDSQQGGCRNCGVDPPAKLSRRNPEWPSTIPRTSEAKCESRIE